jgi:tRNA (guanine10-N2)-dimethyltransferase
VSKFEAKSLAILGRQPELGLAELEGLYGASHLMPLDGAALLDVEAADINFQRLGGTVKIARILATLPTASWSEIEKYLIERVPVHLTHVPEGKFTLGLSAYGLEVSAANINKTGLNIKKAAKRSMRIVPNKSPALSSAQVLHNKLTTKGAWELLLLRSGQYTILAQTLYVQDIEAYAARDQTRPARDPRVGMLPPKLAQIIINLAAGQIDKSRAESQEPKVIRVLDPFCGTGVILQEALLMGYSVYGTDIEQRMVDYSKRNLRWLVEQYPNIQGGVVIERADATNFLWPGFSCLATEAYLGRPLSRLPQPGELERIIQDVNTITKKFLKNLHPQLKPGRRAAMALPAWQISKDKFKFLPVIDQLTDMGYNTKKFKHLVGQDLIYYREGQIVGRHIIVLEKKQ